MHKNIDLLESRLRKLELRVQDLLTREDRISPSGDIWGDINIIGDLDVLGDLVIGGNFYSGDLVDYSDTSTITGWSSFTTKKIKYLKLGKLIWVVWSLIGTSNNTAANFTLPHATGAGFSMIEITRSQNDGGSWAAGLATLSSATVDLYSTVSGSGWAASNTKGSCGQFFYWLAGATNYYVDYTNGNDSADGTTPGTAWKTINKVNTSTFLPGDSILFKRGETWAEALYPPSSGTAGNEITFGAYGTGAKPVIGNNSYGIFVQDKSYLIFEDIDIYRTVITGYGIQLGSASTTASNITIRDVDVSGYQCGMYFRGIMGGMQNILVEDCTVTNADHSGILLDDGPYNCTFRRVTSYDNGVRESLDHGFYINVDSYNVTLEDCIAYDNYAHGIAVKGYSNTVQRCRSYSNGMSGIILNTQPADAANLIINNLLYNNGQSGIYGGSSVEDNEIYHNTIVNNTAYGIHFDDDTCVTNVVKNNLIVQDYNVVGDGHNCIKAKSSTVVQGNTYDNNDYIYLNDPGLTPCNVNGNEYTLAQWQALTGSPDPNSISDDPDFVTDYTDLHIQASSPCIEEGATGTGVTDDFDEVSRGSPPDIGAYEYVPGNYYVDFTNGNDGEDGRSAETAWKTINKVNNSTFLPGDSILFKRGEEWRETLVTPSSGSSTDTILFGAYGTGDKPIINAADAVTGWTVYSGNVWQAPVSTQPKWVFFVASDDTITWGDKKTSIGALVDEYDFYWTGSTLYAYAASDPDTRYQTVEGSQRDNCINSNSPDKSYIDLENIECKFGKLEGIRTTPGADNWSIKTGIVSHHHGGNDESAGHGCYLQGNDIYVGYSEFYECGQHGTFVYSNYGNAIDNVTIEHNIVHDNYHTNIDVIAGDGNITDVVISNNKSYFTHSGFSGVEAYHIKGETGSTVSNIKYYNNLAYGLMPGIGFLLNQNLANVDFQFNSVQDGATQAVCVLLNASTTMVIKNNIFDMNTTWCCVAIPDSTNKTLDYNCYNPYNNYYAKIDGEDYYSLAAMQTDGFETNGVDGDPVYVSSTDLHLQSSSPCLDEGDYDSNYPTDFDGVTRSDPPEIGAYEYIS